MSAFEFGQCLHVRFVSFRFALKGFAWRQTAARCFTVSQSPKTLSCARVWLKKKTECVSFFEYLEKIELYCSKENYNLGFFRELENFVLLF